MINVKALVFAASMSALAVSCTVVSEEQPEPTETPDPVPALAAGNTRFALHLYKHVAADPGNVAFSPYSVSTALAMTYAGAQGDTAREMRQALQFTPSDEDLHRAFHALAVGMEAATGDDIELAVANRLWGQRGEPFLPMYLDLVKAYYEGGLERVDFAGATESTRQMINDWVEQQTSKRIKDLLQEGDLDAATVLVLTNAIYFKGAWQTQFDPEKTRDLQFRVSETTSKDVPTMAMKETFPMYENEHVQVLELPYTGEQLSMVLILPRRARDLMTIEKSLTAEELTLWLTELREQEIVLTLPRFRAEHRVDLARTLQAMGMQHAFTGRADFSGINGRSRDLFISNVFHQTFVEVAEEGTEAAAATAVVMKRTSMPPAFRADHPFLYLIRDRATNSILFMGRVSDPSAK